MLSGGHEYATFFRFQFSGDELEYGRLSSTVLAHECDLRSLTHRKRSLVHEPLRWCISEGDLVEADDDVSFGHSWCGLFHADSIEKYKKLKYL